MNQQIDIHKLTGLSSKEAAVRLKQDGLNELPSEEKRSIWEIGFKILSEPMFLLLIAGGILYFILGNTQEALMLLSFVFIIIGITLYQEHKTERALKALRDLSSPRAMVIRDSKELRIPSREVVRGDILVVREGDYVAADAALIDAHHLATDESLLTGESLPVHKKIDKNIYSSTLAVQGHGIAKVYATGDKTEIGKIGTALKTIKSEKTNLQKATAKLVRNLAIIGLSLCALVVLIYGFTRGHWLDGILAGITLAMAILPEEFPVILTTFLALGAWRISKSHVLTREVPAVETLGSAKVLCVDKTGTLTQNQMTVTKLFANNSFITPDDAPLPQDFHELLQYGMLASQRDPFDPMEKAIKKLGAKHLTDFSNKWSLVQQYPLSEELMTISHVWQATNSSDYEVAAKGAPEDIIELCHLDTQKAEEIFKHIHIMADQGLRILGVAKASFNKAQLPEEQHDFKFEFIGLIGLTDPIRPAVPDAIEKCYTAGIRVIMITGDYAGTAKNIAAQIGLHDIDKVITGDELEEMDDATLQKEIKTTNIFARIVPEQKLRLVNAVKANNEIVAMTGDGVNDAPALKAANIGIAMGKRGTDVARESASLVLLDDDFTSIVESVELGRRIFDNIRKAMTYTFAVHLPIIGLSLLPILLKWPLILFPVHIVFLELIIDPACSIVFEAEPTESNVMQQQPRDPKQSLFNKEILKKSFLQGGGALIILILLIIFGVMRGYDVTHLRTISFTSLIFINLGLILTNRSWTRSIIKTFRTPNRALWWVISGALIFLAAVLGLPFLHHLFHFGNITILDLVVSIIAGIISMIWFEMLKFYAIIT